MGTVPHRIVGLERMLGYRGFTVREVKYHIAGNFDEGFNLALWWICGRTPNLKVNRQYYNHCRICFLHLFSAHFSQLSCF